VPSRSKSTAAGAVVRLMAENVARRIEIKPVPTNYYSP
jgi:hypothetical protein